MTASAGGLRAGRPGGVPVSAAASPPPFRYFRRLLGMAEPQRGRAAASVATNAATHGNHDEDAFRRQTAQIEIPVSVTCEACSGIGAKAGTKPKN